MSYKVCKSVQNQVVFVSNQHDSGDFHWTCEEEKARHFTSFQEAASFKKENKLDTACVYGDDW